MIIVSDTTPLRYLIEIEQVHILERLFGSVIIPEKVAEELQRPKTPQKIKDWMQAPPSWLAIRKADLSAFTPQRKIDDGEREAFALAIALHAHAVLLDDRDAATEAERLNLNVIPTFTIHARASEQGLLDLPSSMPASRVVFPYSPPRGKDPYAQVEFVYTA